MISTTFPDYFIAQMINAVLENSNHKKFLFSFNFRANLHAEMEDGGVKTISVPAPDVHYLIDGTSNYVGVWSCVIYPNIPSGTGICHCWELKDYDWTFKIRHDTWMTGHGAFSELFDIWIKLREELGVEAKKKRVPAKFRTLRDLSDAVTLGTGLGLVCKKVDFKVTGDGDWKYKVEGFRILEQGT